MNGLVAALQAALPRSGGTRSGYQRRFTNVGGAGSEKVERREGEALSHGCEASRVIWARSLIGVKD